MFSARLRGGLSHPQVDHSTRGRGFSSDSFGETKKMKFPCRRIVKGFQRAGLPILKGVRLLLVYGTDHCQIASMIPQFVLLFIGRIVSSSTTMIPTLLKGAKMADRAPITILTDLSQIFSTGHSAPLSQVYCEDGKIFPEALRKPWR